MKSETSLKLTIGAFVVTASIAGGAYVLSFWLDHFECQRIELAEAKKGRMVSCRDALKANTSGAVTAPSAEPRDHHSTPAR